ncbi:MAG: EAL domain-containing protein [Betaproteobacteria bacterium]|nr:EAL domain-containing protein [Betaproteobacteria bacterium]
MNSPTLAAALQLPARTPGGETEARRLAALRRLGVLDTPSEAVFDDLTALAARWCGTPAAVISLVDSDRLWFKSSHGLPLRQVPRTGSLCARVVAQDALLHIEDTLEAGVHPDAIALPGGRIARFYAGVPLRLSNGLNVGALAVVAYRPHRLDEAQRDALLRLGRQAVAALEARRSMQQLLTARAKLERRAAFNAMHARASQIIATAKEEQPMLQAVCDTAVQHGDIRLAFMSRPGAGGRFEFVASAGDAAYLEGLDLRVDGGHALGNGPVSQVWRTGQPYFAACVDQAPELAPWRERALSFGVRSTATVPVRRGGKVWATLSAHLGQPDALDAEAREILVELALNLSQGLDWIDAQQREQELLELQTTLLDHTLAGILVKRERRIVSLNRQFAAMLGYDHPQELEGRPARMLYADDAEYARVTGLHEELARHGQVRAMDVRLRRRDGSELLCDASAGMVRKGAPGTMVWTFVDVTERVRLQRELRHEALHDALSQLPNRRALEEHLPRALARARRSGKVVAVGLIDLDDFKAVNDSLGHEAGDELLRGFARRLAGLMRNADMLARLGGDEFVVVLEDLDEHELHAQLESILARLHRAVETPFELGAEHPARVGMTLGLAAFPQDGVDADALLRQADAALYQLKGRKLERPSWWQLSVRDEDADEVEPREYPAYGADADTLLRAHGGILLEAVSRFVEQLQQSVGDDSAGDGACAALLRCLHDDELARLARSYAEHLRFLVSLGLTPQAVQQRAEPLGQLQALVGIEAAELIPPMALLRRMAMECALAARLTSRTRYRLLRLLEERLQDDLQAQLRAAGRTLGTYFGSLTQGRSPEPGAPWRDVLQALIEPLGTLPGLVACSVLRPNAQEQFEVEASTGPAADALISLSRAGNLALPLRRDKGEGQGLVLPAWQTHQVQTTPDMQRDARLPRWHAVARAVGARSATAIPVAPTPGRCAMVIVLLGRHPAQFDSPWMREFIRGLQSRASHAWRGARAPAAALMVSRNQAQTYRERLFDGGLQMHLQPVVDLYTGECRKVEALARLRLADGRMVPPGMFLPVMGEAELDGLFRGGLEQVCRQLREWDERGLRVDAAINLPPSSLLDRQCPGWVESTLSRHGIEPRRLTLELLETQEIDFKEQSSALHRLKALGVRLAMDDLGAGYSSLQRLAQLPFDLIKVDQGISLNMRKDPLQTLGLMRSIVRLAAELGRSLVVEGVEDRGVIEAALECGARYAQGYGIARPMPASMFPEWVRDYKPCVRPGEVTTYLGLLARCANLRQPPLSPARMLQDDDSVRRFLSEREPARSGLADWYARLVSTGDPGDADESRGGGWLDWLAHQARSETADLRAA